jgi:LmbE family N-acetylglucosaminyl deacetylase
VKRLTAFLLRGFARAARPYLEAQGLLRVSKIFNRSALEWQPGAERVLVIAPHMDDEVIGCGGTLARHRAAGGEVTALFLTDGRRGAAQIGDPAGLVATRKAEATRALGELGIASPRFLDGPDGALADSASLAAALRTVLEATRPEIVYLPFFLEEHPDHRAASALLAAAVRGTSLDFRCFGYEVWTPLFPNCLVRIDASVEAKRRALLHYQSQLAEADYLHTALGLNAYRSSALLDPACRFVEAFYAVPLARYLRLFATYAASAGAGKSA